MRLVLFKIVCVTVFPNLDQLRLQFLDAANRTLCEAPQIQLAEQALSLRFIHIGKQYLSDARTVKRHAGADSRVNAQRLGRIEFFDVHRRKLMTYRKVHGLASALMQELEVGQTDGADVELLPRCLPEKDTRDAEVVASGVVAHEVAARFKVYEEAVHGADREGCEFRDF
jgi:hypothetical protein